MQSEDVPVIGNHSEAFKPRWDDVHVTRGCGRAGVCPRVTLTLVGQAKEGGVVVEWVEYRVWDPEMRQELDRFPPPASMAAWVAREFVEERWQYWRRNSTYHVESAQPVIQKRTVSASGWQTVRIRSE
jgi:hypothetical protein